MSDERRLVYSTDGSLPLPKFESERAKDPRKAKPGLPDDRIVRVGCERRRAGSVTLVYGLLPQEFNAVGKELRKRCGAGGTTKNGVVELQGDHRDAVVRYFAEQGRRAKRMGG